MPCRSEAAASPEIGSSRSPVADCPRVRAASVLQPPARYPRAVAPCIAAASVACVAKRESKVIGSG